jgi:VCBS repeat-containing protein
VFGHAGIGSGGSLELSQLAGSSTGGIDFNTTFTGSPVLIVDTDLSLVDRNSPTLAGATITITNLLDGAAESLSATTTGNITANYSNGTLTLSGTATVAQYQQVLRTITYANTAASPNTTSRQIQFVVDDGAAHSNTSAVATTTLAFNVNENQPPVAVNDAVTTNEDTVLNGNVLIANPSTPDSDPNNDTLTVTQVNGNTADVGNQITLASGALLTLNANGTFSYNPNGQFESLGTGTIATDSFTYTISDDNGGTSSATVTVTITGVNDAPVEIIGTAGRDVLTGTADDDILIGLEGRDILTGGGGNDQFVYTRLVDAGDIITDFEVGSDKIVLTKLLNSLGYNGSDAIVDGYVGFGSRESDTLIQFDPDGSSGSGRSRPFILVENVTVAALNNTNNFVF